jgi:hypothetical protein
MTTIAWDGVTLAADRKRSLWGTPMPAVKIFRGFRKGEEMLFGLAGDSGECVHYRRQVFGLAPTIEYRNIAIICIDGERRVWHADESMLWVPITLPWWAVGSGSDYALGAMAAGQPARRTIEIASKLDKDTGLGIDILRFSR